MPYPPWTSVDDAARLLQDGQVVAIPTETVYGLAGNAYNPEALAKIFAAKERPTFDPLIVHIADIAQLQDIAQDIPDAAYRLAEAYWPGPMTLVLPKKECIPDLCTSGLPSVAVRFPSHPIAQEIIKKSGLPLAAPSANLFKHVSPTTAMHVAEQLSDRIAGISARNQLAGTIAKVTKGAVNGHVTIELPDGNTVSGSITNAAIDDLGLAEGNPAVAIVKATDVIVGVA